MYDTPSFVPPMLNMDGEWEDVLTRLYSVFSRDFKESQTYHRGLRVIYNGTIKPDGLGKEEGFWHMVSRKDKETGERIIDYSRAKRLPWAKPLMENPDRPEIKIWRHKEGPSDIGIRTYIWLEQYDYAIILQQKKRVFYWVTAFYITSNGKRRDLQGRYEKRL